MQTTVNIFDILLNLTQVCESMDNDSNGVFLPYIFELLLPDVWHNRMQHVVFQFHLLRHDVVQLPWLLVTFLNLGRTLQVYPKLQVVYIPSMAGQFNT